MESVRVLRGSVQVAGVGVTWLPGVPHAPKIILSSVRCLQFDAKNDEPDYGVEPARKKKPKSIRELEKLHRNCEGSFGQREHSQRSNSNYGPTRWKNRRQCNIVGMTKASRAICKPLHWKFMMTAHETTSLCFVAKCNWACPCISLLWWKRLACEQMVTEVKQH